MPPADRIREQNDQDPGRVAHTRQEAGSTDFIAVGPALRIRQLNVFSTGEIIEQRRVDYCNTVVSECMVCWCVAAARCVVADTRHLGAHHSLVVGGRHTAAAALQRGTVRRVQLQLLRRTVADDDDATGTKYAVAARPRRRWRHCSV